MVIDKLPRSGVKLVSMLCLGGYGGMAGLLGKFNILGIRASDENGLY